MSGKRVPSRSAWYDLLDRATLDAASAFAAKCLHVRRCSCRARMRMHAFVVLCELRDLGWTLTPPDDEKEKP